MIRVHLQKGTPWVEFPACDGWFISQSGRMDVKKDGEVMAVFQDEVWAWVEDVQDVSAETAKP